MSNLKVLVFSGVDVIAGLVLLLNMNVFLNYIGAVVLLIGFFELMINMAWSNWWKWGGVYTNVIDIAAGIVSFIVALGIQATVFTWVAYLVLFKGIYSFIRDRYNLGNHWKKSY